ncbi:hypothetical protein ACOS7U_10475 [Escherichia coli]|uniref:hypothetical protein n=1 Tax=Escherichia coli TaxID=562 RepID=UPI003B9B197D
MNNSIPERFIFQCALFKNLEREVFMTHGYVDSHIIDQALRLRLKDETSVILSDLYLQILQYIEMHKGRCEQVPDMRSSYSSGAHPRGTS